MAVKVYRNRIIHRRGTETRRGTQPNSNLALCRRRVNLFSMLATDLSRAAMELPPEERLELARKLVESVVAPAQLNEAVAEGIRRIEDIAAGRVNGLTEDQFRAALR